ncbi:MAG TPA: hypothetical protein VFX70_13525 [Mycobacteriales bacterium]|nr:hypothetical protein [Mycobacteriales bacterium]
MALTRKDREFRHPGVSYLDFKQLDMDRVLTAFFARLWYHGLPSRLARSADLGVDDFVDEFLDHPDSFAGFDPGVTRRWVETYLLDMVNRGKPTQAVAGPRPLHGLTYRFRNSRRSRPYGADEHLYEMFAHARDGRGLQALQYLRTFFFAGIDPATETRRADAGIDVETQALLHLATVKRIEDRADTSKPRKPYPPVCQAAADLLTDDVVRLLFHQRFIPRSVMVDYLKILFAFHLGLYHLRLIKVLPALVAVSTPGERPAGTPGTAGPAGPRCCFGRCTGDLGSASSGCGYGVGVFCDVAGVPGTRLAGLAERSAGVWFGRIPEFVRAAFAVKKLDEFATYQARRGALRRPGNTTFGVPDALALLGRSQQRDRENFFASRVASIVEDSAGVDTEVESRIGQILQLGLDQFTTYLEILTAYRGDFHRRYLVDCLDTMLLKNRPGAMIAQPRGGTRRFILDSRLLEVLLQISLLAPGGVQGFHTRALRIDEFLAVLRDRYGLFVDRLPPGDGFGATSITDHAALRANEAALTAKLREIGFFSDLSDAYLTQTITPRYVIEEQ